MSSSGGSYTPPAPRVDAFAGVTDENGLVEWVFDEPFEVPPVVIATVQAEGGFYFVQLAEANAEACVISVVESGGAPAAGVVVHAIATPAAFDESPGESPGDQS